VGDENVTGSAVAPGVWPVMVTPFTDGGEIDWVGLDHMVEWYITSGVAGLFTVCLSSEMYELSREEKLALAEGVVQRASGRIGVVASGTFEESVEAKAEFVMEMAETSVNAVVVLVCQMAGQDEEDSTWKLNVENLIELTPDVPLGLYECPSPYHRVISPDLMSWLANTGRFHYHKDTCRRLDWIEEKIAVTRGTPLRFLNAQTTTLLDSLRMGADGFTGTASNFYPSLYAWLCRNPNDPSADDLQEFFNLVDPCIRHKYPASARYFQALLGVEVGTFSRVRQVEFEDDDLKVFSALRSAVMEWCSKLGISVGDEIQ
jgi:4-hydroxy-tetrahydrodipicolinate synthase